MNENKNFTRGGRFTAIVAALAAMISPAGARTYEVEYDSQSFSFGSDEIRLSSGASGGQVMTVAGTDGDVIEITGDAMDFAGDLRVCLSNNVKLVFANQVSVGGDIEIVTPKAGFISYLAPSEGEGSGGFSTQSDTLAFEGVNVADYELYSSDFSDRGNGISGLAKTPHYLSDAGDRQTAQFQRLDNVFTKCVKVEVFQGENGIMARKLYGKYITGDHYTLNFDTLSGTTRYDNYLMTQLTMKLKVGEDIRSVRFGGTLCVGGDIAVSNGIYAVCEKADGLLDENGVFCKNVTVENGAFVFESPENGFTLCGNFSGKEATIGIVAAADETDETEGEYAYVYKDTMNYSEGYVLVQKNASLKDVVSAEAYGTGNTLYPVRDYKNVPLPAQFAVNDGYRMSCEFQLMAGNGAHFKGMGVHFKQEGSDIYAKLQYAAFIKIEDHPAVRKPGDWHFATQGYSGGNGGNGLANSGTYSVSNLTLYARRPAGSYRQNTFHLQMTNATENSRLVLEAQRSVGICAKVTELSCSPFPVSGTVKVGADVCLNLAVPGVNSYEHGYYSADTKLEIADGGYVDQVHDYQFGCQYTVAVKGGTLAIRPTRGEGGANGMLLANWSDASTYIGHLEYSDGGRTMYASPRIGLNNRTPSVKVSGGEPCRAEHGFALVASYYTQFEFDVDDVTRSDATDFTVTGVIRPFSPAHEKFSVIKTGAGTMELTGENNYTNFPTQVKDGTLLLGASGVMNRDMDMSLEGGSFAVAAGTVNSLGSLAVAADATLTVPSGATLEFADSSAEIWGERVKVDIAAADDAVVRFGDSASSLTVNQLRRIKLNGVRCILKEDGRLERHYGMKIIVR